MDDLDAVLKRLAHADVHPALAGIEAGVLARLDVRAATTLRLRGRSLALAAATAVVMGMAGAALPVAHAEAPPAMSPLGAGDALAPSTLLGG